MKHIRYALGVLALGSIGCGVQVSRSVTPPQQASTASQPSQAKTTTNPPSQEILTALKTADLVDGKEDHVISKCYVCELGMDGKADLTEQVHGYTVHLCSKMCKEHFHEEAEKVILTTKAPAPAAQAEGEASK